MVRLEDRAGPATLPSNDEWLAGLSAAHPQRDRYLRELHQLLRRAARHELLRRRGAAIAGEGELDDLVDQAADDALLAITRKLGDFRGASRFTTWAYKFAIFEVSNQLAHRGVRERRRAASAPEWDQLVDLAAVSPERRAEPQELLTVLGRAVAETLTERQREVFVSVALNEEPMDVVALRLGANRNAVYKILFDARRRLRAALADAGHPL